MKIFFFIPIVSFILLLSNCANRSVDKREINQSISDTSSDNNSNNNYLPLPISGLKLCWIVSSVPYEQNGGLYDDAEIQKIKGRKICFNRDSVILINDTLIGCTYNIIKEVNLENILKNEMNASVKDLGLSHSITGSVIILKGLNRKYTRTDGTESSESKTFFYSNEKRMYYFDGNGTCFLLK